MNRRDLQTLAHIRAREAVLLLTNRLYSGAYYLSGYVVECALKACIAKNTRRFDFPDKKRVDASYTHNLQSLLNLTGYDAAFNQAIQHANLANNWSEVKKWTEESRYQRHTRQIAETLFMAVTDPNDGVFPWITQYW